MDKEIDVVVVGAGPVGLLAAIELTLGGACVLVLERLAAPSTVSKALAIGPLGIEALQRRGMAAPVAAAEARMMGVLQRPVVQGPTPHGSKPHGSKPTYIGHFAAMTLIRADAQRMPERRSRLVDQQAAEAMLAGRARELGIAIRRGCEVTALEQDGEGVEVTCGTAAGTARLRCAWLVACDGGRSAIRKLAGFDFPGTAPTMTMYGAVVTLDHPERLRSPGWQRTDGGVYSYGFLPNRLALLDFSGPPADRAAPVTRAEVEAVLRRISGADVRIDTCADASRWTDNTRLADTYRRGRVLLAGDAAHIHTPFGGQGLNLGLVDAANLGWKLAAVVRGDLPGDVLDTYTAERRPVAEAVLESTLAQAAIMRPDPQAGAMRNIMARLMAFDDVNRYLGEMMTGLATRYDLGSAHDAVGRLVEDRPLAAGTLYGHMQDGDGVLLDASRDGAPSRLAVAVPRLRCIAVDAGPSLLIRPDACIAWMDEAGGGAGLDDALRRWFTSR